jgi:hypothetical protein
MSSDGHLEYIDDPELFDDFLAIETDILIRSGLRPDLSAELCAMLKLQRDKLRQDVLKQNVLELLGEAVERACEPYEKVVKRAPPGKSPCGWFRKTRRVVWLASAGGLVIAANVAAALAIGDVTAEISKAVGSAVIGSAVTTLTG